MSRSSSLQPRRGTAIRTLVPVLATAAVAVAAGCGGGGGSTTTLSESASWANGLCSAVSTWQTSLQSTIDTLKNGNLSKDSLNSAADDVTSANDELKSSLDD